MKRSPKSWMLFCVAGTMLLSSCKIGIPEEVIQPAAMEDLLYDYHVAQAIGNDYNGKERYKRELLMQYVFEKHHTTEAQFDSSLVWYTRNTEKLNEIYQHVGERLEKSRDYVLSASEPDKAVKDVALSGDTVDVWNLPSLYRLTEAVLSNRLSFTLPADTTYHPHDRFEWTLYALAGDKKQAIDADMELGVRYRNDSTASVHRRLTKGLNRLSLQTDTIPIKEVRGFVYIPGDTLPEERMLLLHRIALKRYHVAVDKSVRQDTVSAGKETRPERMEADSVAAKPLENDTVAPVEQGSSRRSPKDLREQNRPERLQRKVKPQPKSMPQSGRNRQLNHRTER